MQANLKDNSPDNAFQKALGPISPIYATPGKENKYFTEMEKSNPSNQSHHDDSRREFSYHSSDDEKSVVHSPTKFISRASKIFIPPFIDDPRIGTDSISKQFPSQDTNEYINCSQINRSSNMHAMRSTKSQTNSEVASHYKKIITDEFSKKSSVMNVYKPNANDLQKDILDADMRLAILQASLDKQDEELRTKEKQLAEYLGQIDKLESEKNMLDQLVIKEAQRLQQYRTIHNFLIQRNPLTQKIPNKKY
jgi:hypothetical protein